MMIREKQSVLLIDDNEPTRTLIRAILQREYTVDLAANGVEAIELLKTRQYSAILLDLLMPQIDGYGVLQFLREQKPALLKHVLVVTAALTAREMAKTEGYEVSCIIRKPFEVEALVAAVRACAGASTEGFGRPILSTGMLFLLADILHSRLI